MWATVPFCFVHNERVSLGGFSQFSLPNPPLTEDCLLTAIDLHCLRPTDLTVSGSFTPGEPWGKINAAIFANQEPWQIDPKTLLKAGEQMCFRFERRWSMIGFIFQFFRRHRFPVVQIAIHGSFQREVPDDTKAIEESED